MSTRRMSHQHCRYFTKVRNDPLLEDYSKHRTCMLNLKYNENELHITKETREDDLFYNGLFKVPKQYEFRFIIIFNSYDMIDNYFDPICYDENLERISEFVFCHRYHEFFAINRYNSCFDDYIEGEQKNIISFCEQIIYFDKITRELSYIRKSKENYIHLLKELNFHPKFLQQKLIDNDNDLESIFLEYGY